MPEDDGGGALNKLPRVDVAFWIMKICATTLGETAGDLLSMTLAVGYAGSSLLLLGAFGGTLAAQLRATRHRPLLYWSVILTTSTAGTTLSDFMDRTLGLGYAAGSALLCVALAGVFVAWWRCGEPLAVEQIATRRGEALYWAAILVSNTLGTALGDFLADDSGLGFAGGAALIGSLLAALVAARVLTRLPGALLFWAAFVLTRPFGATFGDLLSKGTPQGGLGFGTIGSSLVLAAILLALVGLAVRRQRDALAAPGSA